MPYRYYDWECQCCGHVHEVLGGGQERASDESPKQADIPCPECCDDDEVAAHDRLMSAPGKYMYDRPYAPMVSGGRFDTTGNRALPKLPELPYEKDFDQARDRFRSKFYQDKLKERHARAQENAAKKERAARWRAGEPGNDLRTNPLPGDPPIERVAKVKRKRDNSRKRKAV